MVDTAAATYVFDTTGTVTLLNGTATGTDFTNRIGRKVNWRSFLIQGLIQVSTSPAFVSLNRIMIVYDSQPNGALPAVTDVLQQATAVSPLNLNNRDRFRVLLDKRFALGPYNTTVSSSVADRTCMHLNKYRKCNVDTIYDGTTAAIADIQSGSVFMLTIGTQPATSNHLFTGTVRMRFVDS